MDTRGTRCLGLRAGLQPGSQCQILVTELPHDPHRHHPRRLRGHRRNGGERQRPL